MANSVATYCSLICYCYWMLIFQLILHLDVVSCAFSALMLLVG